jgi:internalin A
MMQSCGICFKARELKLEDGKTLIQYIAPELLPRWSESLMPMFRLLLRDPNHLGFEVRYPFLHDGILRGFLSRLGTVAGDHAVYWKYGCWFHEQRSDCDVLIESRWDETGEDNRGSIIIRAWGRNPEEVLRSIAKLLRDHRMVQKPETHYINFAGFDQRIELPLEADEPIIVSAPGTRAVLPDNLGKQVYLSYAWGEDETEIGRQREAAAQRSIERLTQVGYDVTYDKKEMKPGDLISDFIRRIGTARHVVSIISKKYLESPYCIKELYCIFLHSLRDKRLFLGRIHPLILQDARLSDASALKQYRAYWAAKKEEYESLFPHGSEGGVLSAVEIEHWILDMMTVLSFLTDKLSIGVSDGDLDRMIDAVLETLERTEKNTRE